MHIHTRDQAKARAKAIRARFATENQHISYSAALERVAAEQGYANWNVMSSRLSNTPEVPVQVGDRVEGSYLKQPFSGTIAAVKNIGQGTAFEISIDFDTPVDVVEFESFSNFRRRVSTKIKPGGVSFNKTSDGVPQMIVARDNG